MESSENFQVNLSGVIDILARHLYSAPDVYLRELLQNCVDAITARRLLEPAFAGEIRLELQVSPAADGKGSTHTLMIEDNGVGLTPEEAHRFLSTIGHSSKREDIEAQRGTFIGQFGIGMLSCLMVAERIVVVSQSVREGQAPIEWIGAGDGTYTVRELDRKVAPGTRVFLQSQPDSVSFFEPEFVEERLRHYGSFLPLPITLTVPDSAAHGPNSGERRITSAPPWLQDFPTEASRRTALLAHGSTLFKAEFMEVIDLCDDTGAISGVAYVLAQPPSLVRRPGHRVYIKHMLITANYDKLLPDWAFFLRCVVDATDLTPAASREAIYEDEKADALREHVEGCIRRFIERLATENPDRLAELVALHFRSIKAVAIDHEDLLRLVLDHIPFETTLGRMTFGEYRKKVDAIRYAANIDDFRQIAGVAAAQNVCVLNAGYTHDLDLLSAAAEIHGDTPFEAVSMPDLVAELEEIDPAIRDRILPFLDAADASLKRFECRAEIKTFAPDTVPVLYSMDENTRFGRMADRTREVVEDDMWLDVLSGLDLPDARGSELCFNYNNPLVQRIAGLTDPKLIRHVVEMLYVQSLTLGHFALKEEELKLMSSSVWGLIELAIDE